MQKKENDEQSGFWRIIQDFQPGLSEYAGTGIRHLRIWTVLREFVEALDIDIQYALEGEMPGKTVIHREEMSKHLYPEENMTVEVADFGQGESIFEYITIEPGESAKKEEYRHVFSEMCMVIKGTLNVEVEGKICSLHPGDSVYIKSRERHSISNPGKEPCVSIWVYHRDVPRRFERNENKIVK